uniref:BED-type domain-containing protein n=1 Tax=Neolamprologus brichardi TaxID=32507 RepID=A0A3Q4MC22_NEOBR
LQRKRTTSGCFIKWKYSCHFTFLKQADKNIKVICKLCPGEKKLSAAVNSTSNLLKHLTRHSTESYIVEEMLLLRTVESPSFRCILNKIPVCGKKAAPPVQKTFSTYLDKCYADVEMELKGTFESLEYISTTADIWTSHNKSFLGMTAYWIDPFTFVRGHAALACKRVRGRHTYDDEQVHSAYGLNSKVTATVTDNGSNFIKESEEDEEVTFTDVEQSFSTESEGQFSLPPHLRSNEAKFIYRSATSKCSAMWTKPNHSSVASKLVDIFFKKKLIVPVSTQWNSFHDALSRITDIPLADLNTVCTQFGIKCFTDREYLFLKEYCIVLKPLTVALDTLQGEENCYFGILLPTLEVGGSIPGCSSLHSWYTALIFQCRCCRSWWFGSVYRCFIHSWLDVIHLVPVTSLVNDLTKEGSGLTFAAPVFPSVSPVLEADPLSHNVVFFCNFIFMNDNGKR